MTAKFAFIDGEKDHYPIIKMCQWLDVSTSGYYERKDRRSSPAAQRRDRLAAMVTAIFEANHGTYGYRRVHAVLARSDEQVPDELVRELMRELGLVACQPRPWRPTTTDPDDQHRIPDLVGRNFTAAEPGTKLVGDITYISAGASHLAGVVLSSGPAVALGATDPTAENQTTRSATGCGLRRLISAHTVRETVVVALRDDVTDQQERWTAAYAAEAAWLPHDLSGRALPQFPAFLAG